MMSQFKHSTNTGAVNIISTLPVSEYFEKGQQKEDMVAWVEHKNTEFASEYSLVFVSCNLLYIYVYYFS